MNMKQSCKALICAIEGELDGRHCTEEQAAAILDHALPSLTEALARVEAEHADDVKRYRQLLNEAGRDRYAAQKQLAEAVGLLDRVVTQVGRTITSDLREEIDSLLDSQRRARHAQAEKQEAQEIRPLKGAFAEAAEQAFREQYGLQEAQGAQAVDERAAFDKWFDQYSFSCRMNGGAMPFGLLYDAWKARAALATQPAAYVLTKDGEIYWEGDDGIVISNTTGDCLDESYEWRPVGFISQPAVRGAEHE